MVKFKAGTLQLSFLHQLRVLSDGVFFPLQFLFAPYFEVCTEATEFNTKDGKSFQGSAFKIAEA